MSSVNKNITVEEKLISPPTYTYMCCMLCGRCLPYAHQMQFQICTTCSDTQVCFYSALPILMTSQNILEIALHCWFESICDSIYFSVQWHKEINFAVTFQVIDKWAKGLGSAKYWMIQSSKGLGCGIVSLSLLSLKEGPVPQEARIPR